MKPKSLLTMALFAFLAVSVIALIAKEFGGNSNSQDSAEIGIDSTVAAVEDRVVVYYFHGTSRCVTCRTIEAYTEEAVEATRIVQKLI